MKVLFIMVFHLLLASSVVAQSLVQTYSFSRYDYYDEEKKEYVPSKCDCDYLEKTLTLKKNGTFHYTEQTGRLSPEYTRVKGTWKVVDSTLYLTGEVYEGKFLEKIWSESFIIRNTILHGDYISNYTLWDGNQLWEGFGDVVFPEKKKK